MRSPTMPGRHYASKYLCDKSGNSLVGQSKSPLSLNYYVQHDGDGLNAFIALQLALQLHPQGKQNSGGGAGHFQVLSQEVLANCSCLLCGSGHQCCGSGVAWRMGQQLSGGSKVARLLPDG